MSISRREFIAGALSASALRQLPAGPTPIVPPVVWVSESNPCPAADLEAFTRWVAAAVQIPVSRVKGERP